MSDVVSNDSQEASGEGLQPLYKSYVRQKCFIGYSERAPWATDLLEACEKVLQEPEFNLEADYARKHLRSDTPLREKALELIANARCGIYDISHWRVDSRSPWLLPRNVIIELGIAVALNRPALLLRHAENAQAGLALPKCLENLQIVEWTGDITLKKTLRKVLPQWIKQDPASAWWHRHCNIGHRDCEHRESHPRARSWTAGALRCHIADGQDVDQVDFRTGVETELERFDVVEFEHFDELPPVEGYRFLLCSHCQAVRTNRFAIYRITPQTAAETYLAIGMTIGLERQFGYTIPKITFAESAEAVPSLLAGYDVVTGQSNRERTHQLAQFMPEVINQIRQMPWRPSPLPFISTTAGMAEDLKHVVGEEENEVAPLRQTGPSAVVDQDPNFDYQKPADLALQLIDQLNQAWSGLAPNVRAEVGDMLTQVRTELVQAAGDASADSNTAVFQGGRLRAVALDRFLYACERSAAIPINLKAGLVAAHTSASRMVITVTKQDARRIVNSIDFMMPPAPAGKGGSVAASIEIFPDPLARAQKLTRWFTQHWDAISIETEHAVAEAMIRLGLGLEHAQSDAEAEAAALDFLREIKASAPAYEQVANIVDYRRLDTGSRTDANADNIQKILIFLQQHPITEQALQAVDRSTESTPPPDQATESLGLGLTKSAIQDSGTVAHSIGVPLQTSVAPLSEMTVVDSEVANQPPKRMPAKPLLATAETGQDQSQPQDAANKICPNCALPNAPGAIVCVNCGSRLEGGSIQNGSVVPIRIKTPITTRIKQLTTRLSSNPARAKLVTLRGPRMGEFSIRDQMTYIGRDADQCSLVIQGDNTISNVHAIIQIDPRGLFFVKDLSRNGTFINNPYQAVQRDPIWTPLADGDILFLGQTQLQFRELGKKTTVLPNVP